MLQTPQTTAMPGTPVLAVDRFTLGELRKLQADVEEAIEGQRDAARKEALGAIARLANEAELTLDEVMAHLAPKPRRKRSTLPPKYRDPSNPANTWAGRGKRPKWLAEKLAAGARIEDFAIPEARHDPS